MFSTLVHEKASVNYAYRLWTGGNSPPWLKPGALVPLLVVFIRPARNDNKTENHPERSLQERIEETGSQQRDIIALQYLESA